MGKGERNKVIRKLDDGAPSNLDPGLQVVAELTIRVLADGNVSVSGPIDVDLVVIMDTFGRAISAVANHQASKKTQIMPVQKNNIIVPGRG